MGEDRPFRGFSCFMPTEFSKATLKKHTCTLLKCDLSVHLDGMLLTGD